MTSTQIRSLIELLEAARQRPGMYIGAAEPARVESFVLGIQVACCVLGEDASPGLTANELKRQVISERGWKWPVQGLVFHLRQRGLSDAQIVDELFAIELECWKRILHNSGEDEAAS